MQHIVNDPVPDHAKVATLDGDGTPGSGHTVWLESKSEKYAHCISLVDHHRFTVDAHRVKLV